jgi:TonB family protein
MAGALAVLIAAAGTTVVHAEKLLPAQAAADAKAVRLAPISPWVVDYDDNKCSLLRTFGSEEDKHILMLDQGAPDSSILMGMAGSAVKPFQRTGRIHLGTFADKPLELVKNPSYGDLELYGPAVMLSIFMREGEWEPGARVQPSKAQEAAAGVDRIVIRRGSKILSYETGNLKEPFVVMHDCLTNLLTSWGLDAAEHAHYTPPALTNENAVARKLFETYPPDALEAGEQGSFRVRLIVEKDGSISDCFVEEATKVDDLRPAVCKEMLRSKFVPALGVDGQPIRSFYVTMITYRVS